MSVKVKQEDVKPDLDAYNIPVEEEELEFSDSMGNTKIWAMKVHQNCRLHVSNNRSQVFCLNDGSG